jgi:hypothetical protein
MGASTVDNPYRSLEFDADGPPRPVSSAYLKRIDDLRKAVAAAMTV